MLPLTGGKKRMKAYVGVTDIEWYRQLSAESLAHDEVNFWFPSPTQGFQALRAGEPFLFKTHLDRTVPGLSNRIVGVGLFSGFARMHVSQAWSLLGTENGVRSVDELRARIERYRRKPFEPLEDPEIGCVLLNSVQFFPQDQLLAAPNDFAMNIVRGRTYSIGEVGGGHSVVEAVLKHRARSELTDAATHVIYGHTRGEPIVTIPRIGQQAFKAVIEENFHHRCAVTGDRVRPVLQAAHVLPVSEGGEHRVDNGLLLRSDVHTLFDHGYVGVDEKYRLRVSPALRERFGNGDWFYAREGTEIAVPDRPADRPNRRFLEWHMEERFLRKTV